jgi:superkiller protein 3
LLLQLADHHASAGNADEAIAVYERLVAMDLARPIALTNMGLLRFDDGALTEAESLFREAVELDPSLSQAHLGIATLRARLRQWEEAKVAFEAAMREAPTNAQAHLGRIACFAQLGDEAAAMAAATHWTLQDPSSSLAWGERGLRHYRAGDSAAAISALEKALELDANNLNAANSLAWSYAEGDENLDRALELVEHVLAAHPHADAYDTLAAVLEKRGDLQAAVDAMTRAVEMQPDKDDYRTRQDQLMRAMDGKHSSR